MKAELARGKAVLLFITLFVVLCPAPQAVAQEKKEQKAQPPAPSGLALEINAKEGPIGYQTGLDTHR